MVQLGVPVIAQTMTGYDGKDQMQPYPMSPTKVFYLRRTSRFGLHFCIILGILCLVAGIQKRESVNKMYCDDRVVKRIGDQIYVTGERFSSRDISRVPGPDWIVAAPSIQTPKGDYLSYDLEKEDGIVTFSAKNGPGCRWGFTFVDDLSPQRVGGGRKGFSGSKAQIQAAEGKQKGLYLAIGEAKEVMNGLEQAETVRPLILTKDREDAAVSPLSISATGSARSDAWCDPQSTAQQSGPHPNAL